MQCKNIYYLFCDIVICNVIDKYQNNRPFSLSIIPRNLIPIAKIYKKKVQKR